MLDGPGQIRALRGVDPAEGKLGIDTAQDFHHAGLVEEHDSAIRRVCVGSPCAKFGDIPIPVRRRNSGKPVVVITNILKERIVCAGVIQRCS